MHGEDQELALRGERREYQRSRLATAMWADPVEFSDRHTYQEGDFWLGRSPVTGEAIGYHDDRHIFLSSGSRSGKGTSIIINNLCSWKGSAIVLDPKGENASVTAARRGAGSDYCEGIGQKVHVLDPFQEAVVPDDMRSCYNPLDAIDMESIRFNDEAMRIVNAIIIKPEHSKDKFFDLTAQDMLRGVILHVKTHPDYEGKRNLATVRELLTRGEHESVKLLKEHSDLEKLPCPYELLWHSMSTNEAGNGIIAGVGERILSAKEGAPETYQGIYQTCLTETIFLDSPGIQHTTSKSDFALSELKTDESGVSVFLCLSLDDMDNYFKWLRVMITLTISAMIKTKGRPATGHRVLMCLDEFPVLRRMKIIEDSVAQLAGYGLKMFFVTQNLGQLKTVYKDNWETFLGNSGLKLFFALNDHYFTMKYVSDLIGETEVSRDTRTFSEADSENRSESRGMSTSVAEGKSRSVSIGESQSETLGESQSHTEGKSASHTKSTNTSFTKSANWGSSTQHSETQSSNWGKQRGSNTNEGGNSGQSWGHGTNNSHSFPHGHSWGGSTMFQNNQGRSWGRGTSKGENWGGGQSGTSGGGTNRGRGKSWTKSAGYSQTEGRSSSDTRGTSYSQTQGRSRTETEGESLTETRGESFQETSGSGQTTTRGVNQGLHPRPLLGPNEANIWFSPIDDELSTHYPGYCLVLMTGEHPTAVRKANYFEDLYFTGWYDAHPDHPEGAPPKFLVDVDIVTGFSRQKSIEIELLFENGEWIEQGEAIAVVGPFRYETRRTYPELYRETLNGIEVDDSVSIRECKTRIVYDWSVYAPAAGKLEYCSDEPDMDRLGKIITNRRVLALRGGNFYLDNGYVADADRQRKFQSTLEDQGRNLWEIHTKALQDEKRLREEEEERKRKEEEKKKAEAALKRAEKAKRELELLEAAERRKIEEAEKKKRIITVAVILLLVVALIPVLTWLDKNAKWDRMTHEEKCDILYGKLNMLLEKKEDIYEPIAYIEADDFEPNAGSRILISKDLSEIFVYASDCTFSDGDSFTAQDVIAHEELIKQYRNFFEHIEKNGPRPGVYDADAVKTYRPLEDKDTPFLHTASR